MIRLTDTWISPGRMLTIAVSIVLMCLCACTPAYPAGDVNASDCGFEAESFPGFRSFLPDCRAYEMVTPAYTGGQVPYGYSRELPSMAPDGERLISLDFGGFAGTENDENPGFEEGAIYAFSRAPTGWQAEALDPPPRSHHTDISSSPAPTLPARCGASNFRSRAAKNCQSCRPMA